MEDKEQGIAEETPTYKREKERKALEDTTSDEDNDEGRLRQETASPNDIIRGQPDLREGMKILPPELQV